MGIIGGIMERRKDDIYAVEGGVILYALTNKSPYGHRIYIEHSDGSKAMYAHLNKIYVHEGDTVHAGQCIAEIGSTGFSLGDSPQKHLHLSFFSRSAKKLTAEFSSSPTMWVKLNNYPTNTKVSNPYGSRYHNPTLKKHEGLDFSGIHMIKGWEEGVRALEQDYMTKDKYPEKFYE